MTGPADAAGRVGGAAEGAARNRHADEQGFYGPPETLVLSAIYDLHERLARLERLAAQPQGRGKRNAARLILSRHADSARCRLLLSRLAVFTLVEPLVGTR